MSDVHGWGAFTRHPLKQNELFGEYTGELVSIDEAEEHERADDKLGYSYLFNLNEKPLLSDTIIEANFSPAFSGAGEAQTRRRRDSSTHFCYIFVSLFFFDLVLVFSPFLSLLSSEFQRFGSMGSRRRSCCLKSSISASLSLWIIFLSTLNSQAVTVTAPHCVPGSSPDEPLSRDSYLSILMWTESVSSLWRSVAQSWSLNALEDLPVAAPLLSIGSNSWISLRPDLKILWHLPCFLSFWMMITLPTGKICSLSLLDEPVNGLQVMVLSPLSAPPPPVR
ncbi:BnaC08g43790D [Brassica napus]|uniref:(rape) hypothetical protein n=1 Tax=Brassica napus TaxID=3708 RepID=A0A078FAN9_BRANA|nr:unnamed protein product [Brassica napus]CDY10072.1 BnaC08g43790D [Brassica napus]